MNACKCITAARKKCIYLFANEIAQNIGLGPFISKKIAMPSLTEAVWKQKKNTALRLHITKIHVFHDIKSRCEIDVNLFGRPASGLFNRNTKTGQLKTNLLDGMRENNANRFFKL